MTHVLTVCLSVLAEMDLVSTFEVLDDSRANMHHYRRLGDVPV